MGLFTMGYNRRVAIVYFSAALLIVSVGVRMVGSLMSEGGQELSPLDWVMITGIALEFFVLAYYSSFIWSQPDDEKNNHGPASDPSGHTSVQAMIDLQKQYGSLVNQSVLNLQSLKDVSQKIHGYEQTTMQASEEMRKRSAEQQESLRAAVTDIVGQMSRNEQSIKEAVQELVTLEKTLKEFVEGKIKEQVHKEVAEILTAAVSQKMIDERKS